MYGSTKTFVSFLRVQDTMSIVANKFFLLPLFTMDEPNTALKPMLIFPAT